MQSRKRKEIKIEKMKKKVKRKRKNKKENPHSCPYLQSAEGVFSLPTFHKVLRGGEKTGRLSHAEGFGR